MTEEKNSSESIRLVSNITTSTGQKQFWRAIRDVVKTQRQAPALAATSDKQAAPLSFSQQRIWNIYRLEANGYAHNRSMVFDAAGSIDLNALNKSLLEIIRRHEVMRTSFKFNEGVLTQVVNGVPDSILRIVDLQVLDEVEAEKKTLQLASKLVTEPFDLTKDLLLGVTIFRLTESRTILLFITHQVVFDGQCRGIFFRELSILYEAYLNKRSSPLEALVVQYADFARWQREWLSGGRDIVSTQLIYWQNKLKPPLLPLKLPTSVPPGKFHGFEGQAQSFSISSDLTEKLKTVSQAEGVTLFVTLLSILQTLIYRYTQQNDILVFSSVSGRRWRELKSLLGLFANLIALRTTLSPAISFRELLSVVNTAVLEAYSHQDIPFDELMANVQRENKLNLSSLFRVMFAFQNGPTPELTLTGLTLQPVELGVEIAKFDLFFFITNTPDGLKGTLQYKSDLFETTRIAQIIRHFKTLVRSVTSNPDQAISDLPCVTDAELYTMQTEWEDIQMEYVGPRNRLEAILAQIWQDVLRMEKIGIYHNFFQLGGHSLLALQIISQLQQVLGEIVYAMALFDAPCIAEMAAYLQMHYPDAVEKLITQLSDDEYAYAQKEEPHTEVKIDEAQIIKARELFDSIIGAPSVTTGQPKNSPAIFILSPGRSGSTLLSAMLGGHPQLFAPPQLELLPFHTLGERKAAYSGRNRFRLEGLVRALMQIKNCSLEEAQEIMRDLELQNLNTKQFYGLLQEWIGHQTLIEKTPFYTMNVQVLKRIEEYFENPLYIHLARHPYATIRSYIENKIHLVLGESYPFTPREQAELFWLISHQNILKFLANVPKSRHHLVRFEDLVREPKPVLEGICDFLGVDFHPEVLNPYNNQNGNRMTDGLYENSPMLGDPKFSTYQEIDSAIADKSKSFFAKDSLHSITHSVANALGYDHFSQLSTHETKYAPLTFAQQRLWLLHQLDPTYPIYNRSLIYRIEGVLNIGALIKSLDEIVRRQAVLRTTFTSVEGHLAQTIHLEPSFELRIESLESEPLLEREAIANHRIREETKHLFRLTDKPPFRGLLLELDKESHVLVLTTHQIIFDGPSRGIFVQELMALYGAFSTNLPSPLSDLPLQYSDFATSQRHSLQNEEKLKKHLSYWQSNLANEISSLKLPVRTKKAMESTLQSAIKSYSFSASLSTRLKSLSQKNRVTLFVTLLASFQALLHHYTRQNDITVFTSISGRNQKKHQQLIGLFANILPLRTSLAGDPSFQALINRVSQVAFNAFIHQEVPFEHLIKLMRSTHPQVEDSLFQVLFVFQNREAYSLELPNLSVTPLPVSEEISKFDLHLLMADTERGLTGTMKYKISKFNEGFITSFLAQLESTLEAVVDDPELRLSDLFPE